MTCLIGPSGSGKSTLLRCLNRLVERRAGDILLDGASIDTMSPDQLRRRVGMVFQQFNLFPDRTALANITLALRKVKGLSSSEAERIAEDRLRDVGLLERKDHRPANLSGGQQQRVAIARALALDPEVMLFDEVTSALDPELVKGVLGLMADLGQRGMTMVVVTHEMNFARKVADQVVFMDEGRIVEVGPPAQLFDNPKSERLQRFLSEVLEPKRIETGHGKFLDKRTKKATIIEVARLAGVSTATAGRVLGSYGYASTAIQKKVRDAADILGYRPNRLARGFKTGRTQTIGVVVGDIESPFYASILRGIADVVRGRGFGVLVTNSDENVDRQTGGRSTAAREAG